MQEIMEEVDLDQFVNQPVPDDPEKLRLSLIFSKDLITTLQQDIADLHHRLTIADAEYDATHEMQEDEEDDLRAGVHVTNATLTKMDSHIINNNVFNDDDLYGGDDDNDNDNDNDNDEYNQSISTSKVNFNTNNNNINLYEMSNENDEDDMYDDQKADVALNKKKTEHEKFFSTYNILSKQVNTQEVLIESMGSYEALIHLSDNAVTFNKIIENLQMKLKTTKDGFNMVRDALHQIGVEINIEEEEDIMNKDGSLSDDEEEDLEKKLFISNAKEILRESKKMVIALDSTIDELNGAKHLIHPDQKRIFELQSRIKELQVALPSHKIKKLAILNELPRFIKQELSDAKIQKQAEEARELQRLREARKGHKKKRTKTLVDDDIPDIDIGDFKYREEDDNNNNNKKKEKEKEEEEEYDSEKEEETRIETFESTMDGVSTCIDTLQSRLNNINDTLDAMNGDLESLDDPIAPLLKNSIGDIVEEMKTCEDKAHDIVLYFKTAKEYVHPTQNVLITAINQYIEQKVQNDALQKQIEMLRGELSAKQQQIDALKREHNDSDNDNDKYEEMNVEQDTQDFVQTIAQQLRDLTDKSLNIHNSLKQSSDDNGYYNEDNDDDEDNSNLKNKTSLSYDEVKSLDNEITNLRDILQELSDALMNDNYSVLKITPKNQYILSLETRYLNLKKLYRLKFKELESAKDAVIYNEAQIQTKNEVIEELEERLTRIMTSASTAADTRMDAINTMGQKSQTYRTVMDLIDDNLRTTSSALREIEKLAKSNKNQDKMDANDSKDIQNYCRTIKKGLQAVQAEMSGARNFVHPDREMVQLLQEQILEDKNKSDLGDIQQINYQQPPPQDTRSQVKFDENTADNHNTGNAGNKSSGRRTKSVHEIAWSKFNASHETNMEDLQKKEREVLEEEIRNQILSEVKEEYDDKFDNAVAEIRARLQQEIREQIRLEYEDLEAHIASTSNNMHSNSNYDADVDEQEEDRYKEEEQHQQQQQQQEQEQDNQPQIDVEQIRMQFEEQYDNRLEKERKKIEQFYANNENSLNSKLESLNNDNDELQKQCKSMQNEITNLRGTQNKFEQQLKEMADSKCKLIVSTSAEIDALRYKIKMYTEGNWNAVIASRNKNGYY